MSSSSSVDDSSSTTTATTESVENSTTASSRPALDMDPAVSQRKQASGLWREFQKVSKKMFKHSRAYSDIEKTIDRQVTMESELQKQKDRILLLESTQQTQINGFEARYDDWANEKRALESQKIALELEKGTLKEEMAEKHAREMVQAEKDLVRETERANTLVKRLERANAEVSLVKKELEFNKDKLQEWENYTAKLKDVDFESLKVKLEDFFQDCYKLVDANFGLDLPPELLADYSKWDRQAAELSLPLKFPPTNSKAAKRVRVAAALHILATHLCDNIFKPCFIPESARDGKTIKEVLDHQFMAGLRKEEKLTRALLISMCPDETVTEAIDRAVLLTTEDILKHLSFFLSDGVQTFRTGLAALLKSAATISMEMQHSEKMVKVSIEDEDFSEPSDEHLPDFGEIQQLTSPASFEMLNLFPHVYVPEDQIILHQGGFLFPDQEHVIAAEQELRDIKAGMRPRNGRGMSGSGMRESKRERRQSMVVGVENGTVSSSPASPRTGRPPLQS